jgi:hypothetical protein
MERLERRGAIQPAKEENAVKDENVKGATTAFSTFAPLKSWGAHLWLWAAMKGAPGHTEQIRALAFLHCMSFLSIRPRHLRRAQLPDRGPLRWGALLFISAYNGAQDAYFHGFSEKLHRQMHELWRGCVDWRGADDYDALEQFITQYRRSVNFYFNAYPDTSANLRTALRLRAELDELIALAPREPQRFLEGYRRAAQVAWGKPLDEGASA